MSWPSVSASFTRPATTPTYASGQLVANNATAGSVVPLAFRFQGYQAPLVRSVSLYKTGSSVSGASFRLHLSRTSPTVTNGDTGAFTINPTAIADYLGFLDVTSMQAVGTGAAGFGVPVSRSEIALRELPLVEGVLMAYGLIEARGAYTAASGEIFTVVIDGFNA